jgi:hypothetical protein
MTITYAKISSITTGPRKIYVYNFESLLRCMKKAPTRPALPREKRMKKVFLKPREISKLGEDRSISIPVITARTMKIMV